MARSLACWRWSRTGCGRCGIRPAAACSVAARSDGIADPAIDIVNPSSAAPDRRAGKARIRPGSDRAGRRHSRGERASTAIGAAQTRRQTDDQEPRRGLRRSRGTGEESVRIAARACARKSGKPRAERAIASGWRGRRAAPGPTRRSVLSPHIRRHRSRGAMVVARCRNCGA